MVCSRRASVSMRGAWASAPLSSSERLVAVLLAALGADRCAPADDDAEHAEREEGEVRSFGHGGAVAGPDRSCGKKRDEGEDDAGEHRSGMDPNALGGGGQGLPPGFKLPNLDFNKLGKRDDKRGR